MADASTPRRILLGTRVNLASRQRVYRIPDGLEVDDIEHYQIACRRVFFDEVLFVTQHRQLGWGFLLLTGSLAACFGFFALIAGFASGIGVGLAAFALTSLPFLVLFGLRLTLGVDVVTIFGQRQMAQIHFWLRKRRAQELFAQICALVRDRQEKRARELAAEAPSQQLPRL